MMGCWLLNCTMLGIGVKASAFIMCLWFSFNSSPICNSNYLTLINSPFHWMILRQKHGFRTEHSSDCFLIMKHFACTVYAVEECVVCSCCVWLLLLFHCTIIRHCSSCHLIHVLSMCVFTLIAVNKCTSLLAQWLLFLHMKLQSYTSNRPISVRLCQQPQPTVRLETVSVL